MAGREAAVANATLSAVAVKQILNPPGEGERLSAALEGMTAEQLRAALSPETLKALTEAAKQGSK